MAREKEVASVDISREQKECIAQQAAGLPPCQRCETCRDEFFFDQICAEVEGTYDGEIRN
jgi:hypothetical protein